LASNRRQNGGLAEGALLDATNRRLLAELQADARLSLAELGRRVGLSSPAVAERLGRLERDGVIRGYHAEVDPRALGYALSAVIRIRPAPRQIAEVARRAQETPEVVACDRITGDDCFVLRAHVRDVDHLEEVIDRFTLFGQTTTSIVQSSPVPGRGVFLGEEAAAAAGPAKDGGQRKKPESF
jgi:Lrp/AsnC family leucine-responsive transcriptional regulator